MKYFLFPLITGLILMAIINLTVDIGGTWHGPDYTFTANWDKDHYWVLPLRTEERSLRTKQIGFLPKIDTVGLGSSRFWNMDTTMFPPGTRFYNASVSGATVWDYIALWEKFKQDGNIPKNLIIYLDTWNFNKNTWLKYRWLPNAPLVFAFMHENASREMQATALLEWLTGSFYQAVDLINPTVLKASLDEWQARHKYGAVQTYILTDKAHRPTSMPAWKYDGGYLYPDDQIQPKTLPEITAISRNIGLGSMNAYMKDWEVDANAVTLMNYLLTDAKNHGTKVLIIQPPFQQTAYNIIQERPEFRDIPGRYNAIVQNLLATHQNTTYCNAIDPATAGCAPTEFIDSGHTQRSCSQKILDYCLKRP